MPEAELEDERSIWVLSKPEGGVIMPERLFPEADDTPGWAPTGTLAVSTIMVERRRDGALSVLASFEVELSDYAAEDPNIYPNGHGELETLFCGAKAQQVVLPSLCGSPLRTRQRREHLL